MKKETVKKSVIGALAGLLAGFFGSGGGIVVVEGLERTGMDERYAHATSLSVIFPISIVSSIMYLGGGHVPLPQTLWLCGGAAVGGLIGAFVLGRINKRLLNSIFTLLMLISGIRLLL